MKEIKPIGVIHSPYTDLKNMPIQPKSAPEVEGQLEIFEEYTDGLKDLDGFSHIYILFSFHKSVRTDLIVKPFMDEKLRGVFSTRSPNRPNHIGISIVELVKVEENIVTVKGIDALDGTPLLDIKPYMRKFDEHTTSREGWQDNNIDDIKDIKSDDRFL
ncbi:MAG: tRNA (N6-threonylcarbamoyladenosine(37)-N6)-methyltransferase TrmO [Candidatus Delongbacteria bacterium]|nr:tRNA (N6-threonylcarbamoyladenosine(37)-N6)-methyltransferase TrmO [Candidatus Delongbacteria bacterium]